MLLASELTHLGVWIEGIGTVLRRPDMADKNPVLIYPQRGHLLNRLAPHRGIARRRSRR
jgi:hypothetical protein